MTRKIGLVHAIATCETCGKNWSNYLNAQTLAAKHAKGKGHLVKGEIGLVFTYDGRKQKGQE